MSSMIPMRFSISVLPVAAAGLLSCGVYISMNGRVFEWDRVRKNRQEGRFEETE